MVSEYQQGKLYHVKVEVDTSKAPRTARGTEAACAMPAGRSLRRKIVTTYFQVDRPAEASDMPELATGLPTELSRRLGANRMYSLLDANTVSVLADSRIAEPAAGGNRAPHRRNRGRAVRGGGAGAGHRRHRQGPAQIAV